VFTKHIYLNERDGSVNRKRFLVPCRRPVVRFLQHLAVNREKVSKKWKILSIKLYFQKSSYKIYFWILVINRVAVKNISLS